MPDKTEDQLLAEALADQPTREIAPSENNQEWWNVDFNNDNWMNASPEMQQFNQVVEQSKFADQVFNPSPIRATMPAENSKPGESNVSYGWDPQMVGSSARSYQAIHPDATLEEAHNQGNQGKKEEKPKEQPSVTLNSLASSYDNARKAAISDTSKPLKGYCFPECTANTEITSKLNDLIPKITITQYSTDTFPELFQNFIKGLRGLKSESFSNNIEDSTLNNIYSKVDPSPNLTPCISLLFNSLPTKYKRKIILPITSTPLSINSQLDHGWKSNQSLFDFIKKQIGGGGISKLLGGFLGSFGETVLNIGKDVTALTENLMHIFGRDIQLGPYWSLGEGALDNRQTLTFNTILVNDSFSHYLANAKVMNSLFVDSQPMALNDSYKIFPPDIFDVEIDTCVAGKKKYFLCSGQFSCEAKGRYYSSSFFKKVPEAYSLSLTFNSLIPDLLKIQEKYGNYGGNMK